MHEFGPVGIQVFSLGTGRRHESLRVGHLMQTEAAPLNLKYPTAALSMPKSLRGQRRLNGNPKQDLPRFVIIVIFMSSYYLYCQLKVFGGIVNTFVVVVAIIVIITTVLSVFSKRVQGLG